MVVPPALSDATARARWAERAPVVIRTASERDAAAIARIGELDGHRLATDAQLVGELGGSVVAAIDVRSGEVVADPFVPTAGVVDLLGLRARQVTS